jgi:hypothetical protein
MIKNFTKFSKALWSFLGITLLCFYTTSAQNNPWQKEGSSSQFVFNLNRSTSVYKLSTSTFEQQLQVITPQKSAKVLFPSNQDQTLAFLVKETQVLSPKLAAKYPTIKTYKGVAADGSGQTIRFSYAKAYGFYGVMERTAHQKVEVRPIDQSLYEFKAAHYVPFECETESYEGFEASISSQFGHLDRNVDDGTLRRYRLALAASGDYAQVFLDGTETSDSDRKAKVLQAMVTSVNRLNGIFERDLGITLQLIEGTDALIFLDPITDPFSANIDLRNELVTTLSNTLDESDYDVGHLYHKDGDRVYGNAGCIACVCTDGEKGKAYTVHRSPDSDAMNLIAAHEFGHQFGAYHTQSSSRCRSGRNGSEVEPGSGSTIMSYAGICPANVQEAPDDYFNYTSIRDIAAWTIDNSNCAEPLSTSNTAPQVTALVGYTIPKSTAFVLEAQASDADVSDVLTYCWEQNDSGNPNSTSAPATTRTVGPMFRSYPPTIAPQRYFPKLETVLNNTVSSTWEVMPSVSRDLNFAVTVRDNGINGGQVVQEEMRITVNGDAGPFAVTSQTDAEIVWTVGDHVTVTWDVAATNLAPINTAQVEMMLSIDGGLTFTESLLITDNDGEATFQLIDVPSTTNARLMIKAVDNVFFAVNQQEFEIQKSEFNISSNTPNLDVCDTTSEIEFNLTYTTFLEFQDQVNFSAVGVPNALEIVISPLSLVGAHTAGTAVNVTLTGINNLHEGDYNFKLIGNSESGSIQKELDLEFSVYSDALSTVNLETPVNNAREQLLDLEFNWATLANANSYTLQIATDPSFAAPTLVEELSTSNTRFISSNLTYGTIYFWRVIASNPCGVSNISVTNTFSTFCSSPSNIEAVVTSRNSIEVVWSDALEPNSWIIEYGERGFTAGTGMAVTVNEKRHTALNLESSTFYDFYVRGNCGAVIGDYVGPFPFRTEADYCGGDRFYDSGGALGNYLNNENTTTVIAPNDTGDRVVVTFNSFDIESCCDALTVYDGNTIDGQLIGRFTSNPGTIVSTHSSGALTFVFTSDSSVAFSGWKATVVCETNTSCFALDDFGFTAVTPSTIELSWEDNIEERLSNWTIEYGLQGFETGSGTIINTDETTSLIENLRHSTSYDFYIRTNCTDGNSSRFAGPLTVTTACIPEATEENLIINGGFECGDLIGWTLGGEERFSGCTHNFQVLTNSTNVCVIVDDIEPTQGNFAAFTSFDSSIENTRFSISQHIAVPNTITSAENAILSLDVLVNYNITFSNPTKAREFSVSFSSLDGVELFEVEKISFGIQTPIGTIDRTITHDILSQLVNYAGETIVLDIEAFIPESSTGPAKALVDNISLVIGENTLSTIDFSPLEHKVMVYPVLNSGVFTIQNTTGKSIRFLEIYDVSGRLVHIDNKVVTSQKHEVSLEKINAGVYFVRINIEGDFYSRRIVIE